MDYDLDDYDEFLEIHPSTDTNYKIPVIDARHDKVFGSVYDKDMNVVIADDYTSLEDFFKWHYVLTLGKQLDKIQMF